jgi:cell division protein FtsB
MWSKIASILLSVLGEFLAAAISRMMEKKVLNRIAKRAKYHALALAETDLENEDKWDALVGYIEEDARMLGTYVKENARNIIGELAVAAAKKELADRLGEDE